MSESTYVRATNCIATCHSFGSPCSHVRMAEETQMTGLFRIRIAVLTHT